MSVACSQPAGWILDHLSFINKSGYQRYHSHDHSWATLGDAAAPSENNLIVTATPQNVNFCRKVSISGTKIAEERLHPLQEERYVFREEFFNVFKPHILDFETELCPKNTQVDQENGASEEQKGAKSGDVCFTAKAKKVQYT